MKPKRKPRPIRVPAIVGTVNVFAAPLKLLHDIRHGMVLDMRGSVLMPSTDEYDLFDASATLRLFAAILKEMAALLGQSLDTQPLRMLAARLDAQMPIDDGSLRPVEKIFERGQHISNQLKPAQILTILREYTA